MPVTSFFPNASPMISHNTAAGSLICTSSAISKWKHGVVVSVVNLYADVVGNPNPPKRFKTDQQVPPQAVSSGPARRSSILIMLLVIGFMLFTLAVLGIIFAPAILRQTRARETTAPAPAASAAPVASSIPEK